MNQKLVNQAADEQDENLRPELSGHIENPERYDTIILGFPNWWGDLPMPDSQNDTVANATADSRNQQTLYLWERDNVTCNNRIHTE